MFESFYNETIGEIDQDNVTEPLQKKIIEENRKLQENINKIYEKINRNNDKISVMQNISIFDNNSIELWKNTSYFANKITKIAFDRWHCNAINRTIMYVDIQHLEKNTFLLKSFRNPITDIDDDEYVLNMALYKKLSEMCKDIFPLKFTLTSFDVREFDNGTETAYTGSVEPNILNITEVVLDHTIQYVGRYGLIRYDSSILDKNAYPYIRVYYN
jgi:hypothetical protein